MPVSTINSLGPNGEVSVSSLGTLSATVTAGQLTYSDNTAHVLFYDPAESAQVCSTSVIWSTMKTFTVAKQGTLRIRFDAYILSGPNYFAYRVMRNGATVIASGNFANNLDGATNSVHAYRPFTLGTTAVMPGDVITVEMISSNGSGVPVAGTASQTNYLRNLRVSSSVPDITYSRDTAQHFVSLSRPLVWNITFTSQTSGSFNVNTQFGIPVEAKALSCVGYYHITGYSSGWNDHALSQFGPRAQAGATPWSFTVGTSSDTEWGSYTLEHDGDSSGAPHYYGAWNGVGLINVSSNGSVFYTVGRGLSGGTHYNTIWVWGYWI